MGGCADREDKFHKKRKISDFQGLQDAANDSQVKNSSKRNEKSHSFQHHFDQIHSKQLKTQANDSDQEESSEEFETKQGPHEKMNERRPSLALIIDRQLESEAMLVSPSLKIPKNSVDHCESLSIINNKRTEKPVFLDFSTSLTIPADPNSCIHERNRKKTIKTLDRCSDLSIISPKLKKRLKIVKVYHELCKPVKPKRLVLNSGSRPESPEPERRLVCLSFHKFSSFHLKRLKSLPDQPDINSIRPEQESKSLSSQSSHIKKMSPNLRKIQPKDISTDLTTIEVSYHSSQPSDKFLERRFSDLMTPASPLSPFEVFSVERLSLEDNSKVGNFDSFPEIQRQSYRRATESRDYQRRDSLQQVLEMPEESPSRPEFRRLSTRLSELGLREAKNQAVLNKTRFFRRGATFNNF